LARAVPLPLKTEALITFALVLDLEQNEETKVLLKSTCVSIIFIYDRTDSMGFFSLKAGRFGVTLSDLFFLYVEIAILL